MAQARVTVPQAIVERGNNAGPYHSVLVTPLGAHYMLSPVLPASSTACRHGVINPELRPHIVKKVILKATVKEGKELKCMKRQPNLKKIITNQFPSYIVSHNFDIGIENGGGVISLRTQADLAELWSDVIQGKVH